MLFIYNMSLEKFGRAAISTAHFQTPKTNLHFSIDNYGNINFHNVLTGVKEPTVASNVSMKKYCDYSVPTAIQASSDASRKDVNTQFSIANQYNYQKI